MDEKMCELLLRSFDANLTPDEQILLDEALAISDTLRLEQEQINIVRDAIGQGASHSFRPFFAERVMQRIQSSVKSYERLDPFFESLMAAFRPVMIAAGVLIAIMLSYNAVRHDGALMAGVLTEPDVSLEEAFDPVYDWIQE